MCLLYHDKKQYETAALFMTYAISEGFTLSWWNFADPFLYLDKYASTEQVKKYLKIIENSDQNSLEYHLIKKYKYDKNRYLDLLGTIELRNGNLDEALDFDLQVDFDFWQSSYHYSNYLSRNPFKEYFQNVQIERTKIPYTDRMFENKAFFVTSLKGVSNLYNNAKGEEKGRYALMLANAYYNTTYFGKHWHYLAYGKSIYGGDLYFTISTFM